MSWLDLLGDIAKIAAPVSQVIGKQQQGAATGKQAQATVNQNADRNALSLYQDQQAAQNQAAQLDLERQAFTTSNRGANAKQALAAQMMSAFSPTSVSVPGIQNASVSGGLASTLRNNPGLLQTLSTVANQANGALSHPQAFTGGSLLAAPKLSATPQIDSGGAMSAIANGGQIGAAAIPGILDILKKLQGGTPGVPQGSSVDISDGG